MSKRASLGCYNPTLLYKPQWAYKAPPGFRAEPFFLPFTFTIPGTGRLARGFPWSLDDDVPFALHALLFPQIGSTFSVNPGYCRMWDTHGNPLSKGLVLGLGMFGQAGWDNALSASLAPAVYAWGFPFEPAIQCEAGGTILFDFELNTNALVATFFFGGLVAGINFTAGLWGAAGNAFTIALLDPGAPNVALSVAVVGGVNVQVTLATDGGGVITSTFGDVVNLINSSPLLVGIMGATFFPPASEVITAFAVQPLVGGDVSTPLTVIGTMMGHKFFEDC